FPFSALSTVIFSAVQGMVFSSLFTKPRSTQTRMTACDQSITVNIFFQPISLNFIFFSPVCFLSDPRAGLYRLRQALRGLRLLFYPLRPALPLWQVFFLGEP